jgi:vancomycin permeability regulator SanA
MRCDVGIVLGGGKDSDQTLNERSIARLDKAIELFRSMVCPRLILSGGISFSAPADFVRSEASLMRDYMLRKGIPEAVLYVEEQSTDTLGNAYFSRVKFLDVNGWRAVVVVTSAFHIDRASYLFQKVLGHSFCTEFVSCTTAKESLEQERLLVLERHIKKIYGQWLDDVIDGDHEAIKNILFQKHPGHARNPEFTKEQFVALLYGNG